MTVQNQNVKNVYRGNGSATVFPFTFAINKEHPEYIHVYITNDGGKAVETNDFTCDMDAKTITYPKTTSSAAKLSSTQRLTIYRLLPYTQELNLVNQGPFFAEDVETELDDLEMQIQQMSENLARCFQIGVEAVDFDMTMELEPDKVICVNSAGNGFEAREALMEVNGTWDGEGRRIVSVADPTAAADAATKKYVDENINYVDDTFLKLQADGNAWEGRGLPVSNVATPGKVKDATTKEYVDNLIDKLSVEADRYVVFNTVAAMVAADLPAGYNTRTLGYYDINDGGAGVYSIRGKVAGETEDGGSVIFLANGNVAELIIGDSVNVHQFGAKGDGITDDTAAFDMAILYALKHNMPVQLLAEVYIIASRHISLHPYSIPEGGSLIINGVGKSSVIKRKDNSVTGDTQSLFVAQPNSSNTTNVALVQFSNLKIDSNATNNTPVDSGYTYEHCADVRIRGIATSKIDNVIIENVWATDGVADHFYFPASGDAYVNTVKINGFFVDYRNRTRSDICVTGYVQNMIVSNIKCVVFEYEYNVSAQNVTGNLLMTNCVLERLDLIAYIFMQLENVITTVDTCFRSMTGIVNNCVLAHGTVEWERLRDIRFYNCIFNLNGINDSSYLEIEETAIAYFSNCKFNVMDDGGDYNLIHKDVSGVATNYLEFDNCEFDTKATKAIRHERSGTLVVKNCEFRNEKAITFYSSSTYPCKYFLQNVRFKEGTISGSTSINNGTIEMDNVVAENMSCAKMVQASSAWANNITSKGGRTILITEPLTAQMFTDSNLVGCFFNGDKIINTNPIPNAPNEWICRTTKYTANGTGSATLFSAIGEEAHGTTAERPTCIMGDGFRYFDTDLGKPIYRKGNVWVDATGATV